MNRDELIAVLADHREDYDSDCGIYSGCMCGWDNGIATDNNGFDEHLADVVLALGAVLH